MIDIQELKNCQENNSIGYMVWALPQIIKELEALRDIASYHMASLCASGVAYLTCTCYGCGLLRKLDETRRG